MNDVERMKQLSSNMTFFKENYEREDDFKIVLKQEASMVDLYTELICKKKEYGLYMDEDVQKAMENALEDMMKYIKKLSGQQKEIESQLEKCNYEEAEIWEKEKEIRWEKSQKEEELRSLGLFDRVRKKELKKEIEGLKFPEAPYDFEAKRKELNFKIEELDKMIYPYQERIKGLANAWDKCKVNEELEKMAVRKKAYAPEQENQNTASNTASEAPILKELKEISIPDLKPLKRL